MRTLAAFVALIAATPALASEPDPELLAQAKRHRTTGWAEIGGGATLSAGGLALMIAGRRSGDISTEDPVVHEVRTISGVGCLLVGLSTAVVGVDQLRLAGASRRAAFSVTPEPIAQGAGLRLTGRF